MRNNRRRPGVGFEASPLPPHVQCCWFVKSRWIAAAQVGPGTQEMFNFELRGARGPRCSRRRFFRTPMFNELSVSRSVCCMIWCFGTHVIRGLFPCSQRSLGHAHMWVGSVLMLCATASATFILHLPVGEKHSCQAAVVTWCSCVWWQMTCASLASRQQYVCLAACRPLGSKIQKSLCA